jgi:hypothetical protein
MHASGEFFSTLLNLVELLHCFFLTTSKTEYVTVVSGAISSVTVSSEVASSTVAVSSLTSGTTAGLP